MSLEECTRDNTCYECDNMSCYHAGRKDADCPFYECSRPDGWKYQCDTCAALAQLGIKYKKRSGKA